MKQFSRWVLGIGLVGVVSGLLTAAVVHAAEADVGEKIYKSTLRSTVWVFIPVSETRAKTGTGSLIDVPRRLILTNYHVVGEKDSGMVYFPIIQKGKVVAERKSYLEGANAVRGKVVARDSKRDLALIQLDMVPADARPLKLAKDSPGPGQRVHSIGNPGASGALWVYTPGSVRQVYQKKWMAGGADGFEVDARIVETQSPVNSGDSGGPVVNDQGELVAVTQGHLSDAQARLMTIFIDVTEVKAILASKGLAKLPAPPKETPKVPVQVTTSEKPEVKATSEDDAATKAEREAGRKLKYAKDFIQDGKLDNARKRCQEIIDKFPKTEAAKQARELLEKIK